MALYTHKFYDQVRFLVTLYWHNINDTLCPLDCLIYLWTSLILTNPGPIAGQGKLYLSKS